MTNLIKEILQKREDKFSGHWFCGGRIIVENLFPIITYRCSLCGLPD